MCLVHLSCHQHQQAAHTGKQLSPRTKGVSDTLMRSTTNGAPHVRTPYLSTEVRELLWTSWSPRGHLRTWKYIIFHVFAHSGGSVHSICIVKPSSSLLTLSRYGTHVTYDLLDPSHPRAHVTPYSSQKFSLVH